MKITSVDTTIVRVPFGYGDDSGGRGGNLSLSTMNTLLVRVATECGLVGWGEAFGFTLVDATKAAIDTVIAPLCIGQEANDPAALGAMLARRLHNYGRNGPASFGIAGIDIALWDLAGKAAGQPLHALLGTARRIAVPAYASLLRYADATIVARNVARMVALGYRAIKLHEIDPAVIRAARAAAPDHVALMVDVNCPWRPDEAIAIARALDGCALHWLEEPVWPPEDFAGLGKVAAASPIAIAAGENATTLCEFTALVTTGAVRFVQPSVSKIGVSGMRAVMALAARHGVTLAPHSPYFGPGLLASVHIAAASEQVSVERYGCDLAADLFGGAITPAGGMIAVPDGPGLGIDPSPEVIARFG